MTNKQLSTKDMRVFLIVGQCIGIAAIVCTMIWFFIQTTGPFVAIALWSTPFFVLFAILAVIRLSMLNKWVLVTTLLFIGVIVSGLVVPYNSPYAIQLAHGFAHYYDSSILFNPIFIAGVLVLLTALREIRRQVQGFTPANKKVHGKELLTVFAVAYSLFMTAAAAIIFIGLSKTPWF